MKIISFTDVITNSSSETYLIKSDKTYKELEKELINLRDSDDFECSGTGGDIDVYSSENSIYYPCLEKGYLIVSIDWALDKVIEYLKSKYGVLQDLDWDDNGPYMEMEKKWAKNKIAELEKEISNASPSRQKEICKEIEQLETFINAHS